MKRISMTLATLLTAASLTVTAQAATKTSKVEKVVPGKQKTTVVKTTKTEKVADKSDDKTEEKTDVKKSEKVAVKGKTTKKTKKATHDAVVSEVAKDNDRNNDMTRGTKVSAVAKDNTHKKAHATTKTGKKTQEVNIDIPADVKLDENRNANVRPGAAVADRVAMGTPAVVVPVTKITQTAPATTVTTVVPVTADVDKVTTTTTIPVSAETVPVVMPVQ